LADNIIINCWRIVGELLANVETKSQFPIHIATSDIPVQPLKNQQLNRQWILICIDDTIVYRQVRRVDEIWQVTPFCISLYQLDSKP